MAHNIGQLNSGEFNLVEMWLRYNPSRWIAGVLAGLFSGLVTIVLAMIVASGAGMEFWFPAKFIATIPLGAEATELGASMYPVIVGLIVFELFCAFLGFVFAHFTGTNSLKVLLPMGAVWGVFSWIFLWNLYLQSFTTILSAQVPSTVVFPICIVFGLGLSSVVFFDHSKKR